MSKSVRRMSLATLGLACAGALALAAAPAPEPERDPQALVNEELQVCADAVAQLRDARNGQMVKPDDPRFDIWILRWVQTIQASSLKQSEKIAALEKVLALAKDQEKEAEAWVKAGQAPTLMVLAAKFRRIDAALALALQKER